MCKARISHQQEQLTRQLIKEDAQEVRVSELNEIPLKKPLEVQ